MARKRESVPMIYVGPGFRDMDLNTYGIFADGVPSQYVGTVFEKLFVPPEQLQKARREIAVKGTLLHTLYQRAREEHKKRRI